MSDTAEALVVAPEMAAIWSGEAHVHDDTPS